jgi:ABC-type transport system involved in cytochrome bd biosynthesis fused ATPase/permease subunit
MEVVVEFTGGPGGPKRLELASGERVAIVGPTGKTPLLETLALLRLPAHGLLEYDGIDARQLNRPATRRQIAFLGRPEVFAGTLAENVRLGRDDVSAADIRRAFDAVCLADRAARLPDGLETAISPDGKPLSNNEIGRLAIARAIVGRPRLLLLDGSLDGLDLESCPELLDALFDPAAPWTLVLVTARHDIRSHCGRIVRWS